MPKLAAFPKAYIDDMCTHGTMSLGDWLALAASLGVDGVEHYIGFREFEDPNQWPVARRMAEDRGLDVPMLCASPDFTHPDAQFRQRQIDRQRRAIDLIAALGGQYCRVLSGQRRPEVTISDGLKLATDCIQTCLEHAQQCGITLTLENHYKDHYWKYPEFAQHQEVFCKLVAGIDSPHFGVNYDPSNTILAGEDPLELLRAVKHRVVTMHASDRYLAEGTIEDLRREEDSVGYAKRLRHGEIGQGMNDYDAIFRELAGVGFDGWISIEDGVDGIEQLRGSVAFLRRKMAEHWHA